ncbi:MAG TPA: hypothetical protein VGP81_07715 [Pyrinomonadaceae bacterium]|jgi:hypothetical protein|nr:hypothetical protein [Pyrinomonadaceae bacterium]
MTNSDTMSLESVSSHHLGKLLLRQTGATRLRTTVWLLAALFFFGLGVVVLFTELWELGIALIAVGLLYVFVVLFGRLKSIECYENGLIVRKPFKSYTVLHKDVAAVQFLAVRKYCRGLYQGTISHFIIMPMLDKTVTVRIHGSQKDSERVWAIVETVLTRNPDARLEELQ